MEPPEAEAEQVETHHHQVEVKPFFRYSFYVLIIGLYPVYFIKYDEPYFFRSLMVISLCLIAEAFYKKESTRNLFKLINVYLISTLVLNPVYSFIMYESYSFIPDFSMGMYHIRLTLFDFQNAVAYTALHMILYQYVRNHRVVGLKIILICFLSIIPCYIIGITAFGIIVNSFCFLIALYTYYMHSRYIFKVNYRFLMMLIIYILYSTAIVVELIGVKVGYETTSSIYSLLLVLMAVTSLLKLNIVSKIFLVEYPKYYMSALFLLLSIGEIVLTYRIQFVVLAFGLYLITKHIAKRQLVGVSLDVDREERL